MKQIYTFVLLIVCLVLPTSAFSYTTQDAPLPTNNANANRPSNNNHGGSARPQDKDQNRPQTDGRDVNVPSNRPNTNNVNRPSPRPSNNVNRPSPHPSNNVNRPSANYSGYKAHPNNDATNDRHSYRPAPPPPRHHYVHHTYTTTYYTPTVVYTKSPSYVVVDDSEVTTVSNVSYDSTGKFGFGLNAIMTLGSPIDDTSSNVAGGIGVYFKFRPIRYISIELQNGYMFGSLEYHNWGIQNYEKTLFGLGVRGHLFDYGNVDVYAALAGTVSIWSYIDWYDNWYNEYVYMEDYGVQYGGQIGAGVSYISDSFEIGVDLRYTAESVPNFIPGYLKYSKDKDVIHGMIFTFNVGFSL